MDDARNRFNKRQRKVSKKHRRLATGYVTRVNKVGVIEHRPRRSYARLAVMPVFIVLGVFMAFKVMLVAQLGEEEYLSHLAALQSGGTVEQIGATIMQIDPATERVVGLLQSHL